MKSLFSFILIVTLFSSVSFADEKQAKANPKELQLLFAGSSSTYWNDLPDGVSQLVSKKIYNQLNRVTQAKLIGRSGDGIHVYLRPDFDRYQYGVPKGSTFLKEVKKQKNDYVVLMAVAQFINGKEGTEHAKALDVYCKAIRKAGGEPVYYEMGWRNDEVSNVGRKKLFESAVKNKVKLYAPCSTAWMRVNKERPQLDLQHKNDRVHPGDLGHFLNLACFYAAFTRNSPQGKIPRDFHVWPHFTKEEREKNKEALEKQFEKFVPTPYQKSLPTWMQKNAGSGVRAKIDEKTAAYLEKVAWETWKKTDKKLRSQFESKESIRK